MEPTYQNHQTSLDYSRLDRIEVKIDKLTDCMIAIATAEEKLVSLEHSRLSVEAELKLQKDASVVLVRRVDSLQETVGSIKRVFWLIVTAVVTIATGAQLTGVLS